MITIKTKEEIAILREGGKRHAAIMRELVAMARPGVTGQQLEDRTRELIALGGDKAAFLNFKPSGSGRPFPAALCLSINDEIVHGIPNEAPKVLKEGDIATLDFGLVHGGLYTDMAVTVAVGEVSSDLRRLMAATREALSLGIKAAKGGKKVGDVSTVIERVGIAGKFGVVEELAGHGVGYGVHEDPFVPNYGEAGKGPVLKPGMVLAIEPIFNLGSRHIDLADDGHTYLTADGSPSAHFEHTVVITGGDAEILTQ